MKRLRFVWVDDKKSRVEDFRDVIEAGLSNMRATIDIIEVKQDILDLLSQWTKENEENPPDLFIIDHIFNQTLPFGLKGSSVAHLLRGAFPKVPMVCVTAMFNRPNSFDQEDISEYTALFLFQHLDAHIEDLYAIARDFRKLHISTTSIQEHFVACLKAPRRDRQDLLRVLPEEFHGEKHATTEHRMARWIFNTLLKRPGFLYDELHAATLLGLSESGFKKVEALFEKAKYKGVFATDKDPRWWVSAIRTTLFDLVGEDSPDLPQHAGRQLPNITADDVSVCYVTKKSEPPPDAVVTSDTTGSAKRRVVRRQYSDRNPNDQGSVAGFETRLVLKRTSD
jgi:hypothetical protein